MMDQAARNWRQDGLHLPEFMRDFHDQKDLFKSLHEMYDVFENKNVKHISWVDGQIYTIDFFLWFMAMHGYTLQKTRKRAKFYDIHETMRRDKQKQNEVAILSQALSGDDS